MKKENIIKKNGFLFLLILFIVLSCFNFAHAEEIDEPIVCNGDEIEYFEQEKKVVGSGNIEITYKDIVLTCDKVTVWTDTKIAQAEGNVKITEANSMFSGEKITYNFEQESGTVVNFKGFTDPWYAKGESAERPGPDKIIINNGYLTTCDHENPHYRLTARQVLIYPESKVVIKDVTARIGNIPILWLPVYAHPLDDDRPHVIVIPGKNSDWGNYILTAWRYNLDQYNKGYVHLDYRERKDFASGIDHSYDTVLLGKGTVKTYYTNERDLRRGHVYDDPSEGDPTREQEKFLAQWRHQWDITPSTEATIELYKYKDKNFRKDYFFQDYERDENPRSYLLITKSEPTYNLSLLTEKRANRFETTVERLPELKLDIYNNRIGSSNFYHTGQYSAVTLNKKFPSATDEDSALPEEDNHNNRYDVFNKISYATRIGFLNVTPYAGTRQTYYQRGLDDNDLGSNSHLRGVFNTGIDISTKIYKVLSASGKPFGIEFEKLRHVITPSINYNYIPPPTINTDKLYNFDSIDEITRNNTITIGLENKLQAKRADSSEISDIARLGVSTTYDFKHNPGSQFLDYKAELELRPYDWLTVTSNAVIDSHKLYSHEWLKEINTNLTMRLSDDFRVGISHGYIKESNNLVTQLEWRINPKWKIKVYENFDFKRDKPGEKKEVMNLREQSYVLTRDLHCWEMDMHYNILKNRGHEILVIFRIKAFPKLPFSFSRSYHEPKQGSYGHLNNEQ